MVIGLLVMRPLSPGSDCSESESSLAIRIKCTQEANPGLGQRADPRILAEVPRREAGRFKQKARSEQIAPTQTLSSDIVSTV